MEENKSEVNQEEFNQEEFTQSAVPASQQSSDAVVPRSTEIPSGSLSLNEEDLTAKTTCPLSPPNVPETSVSAPAVLRRQILHKNMVQTSGKNINDPSGP
jgi:hypothetical protein